METDNSSSAVSSKPASTEIGSGNGGSATPNCGGGNNDEVKAKSPRSSANPTGENDSPLIVDLSDPVVGEKDTPMSIDVSGFANPESGGGVVSPVNIHAGESSTPATDLDSVLNAATVGGPWTAVEIEKLYELLKEKGQDFEGISAILDRSEDEVKGLYNIFQTFTLRNDSEDQTRHTAEFVRTVLDLASVQVNPEKVTPSAVPAPEKQPRPLKSKLDALEGVSKKSIRNMYEKAVRDAPIAKLPLGRKVLKIKGNIFPAVRPMLKDFMVPRIDSAIQLMEHRGGKMVTRDDVDAALLLVKSREAANKADA